MPIVPNFTERLMLLKLNQAPGPMLDFLGAQAFRVLCGWQARRLRGLTARSLDSG